MHHNENCHHNENFHHNENALFVVPKVLRCKFAKREYICNKVIIKTSVVFVRNFV